jgi:hypothetical protein
VELPEHLVPGTSLEVVLETEVGSLRMVATVLWIDPSDQPGDCTLHGLQFSETGDDRDRLAAWLQRHGAPPARVAASLPVRCRRLDGDSSAVEGWTADLAPDGCALFLPERLPVGALLEVILSTPSGEVPIRGVVVWEGQAGARGRLIEHGFRFTRMRAEQGGLVREIVEAIHATRAPDDTEDAD